VLVDLTVIHRDMELSFTIAVFDGQLSLLSSTCTITL